MAEQGVYRIHLGGRWTLADFYQLPHVFEQLYSFHCAFVGKEDIRDMERLERVFSSYPWQGGYSAVNFYRVLFSQIPRQFRPNVKAVRYASPGWMDVQLLLEAAKEVALAVGVVAAAGLTASKLYNEIRKGLQDRKLLGIEIDRRKLRLAEEEIEFVEKSSVKLCKMMGFKKLKHLDELTGSPLASLKILLSYYRRISGLISFVKKGQATFPSDEE